MQKEFGGAAKAAGGTFAGSLTRLKNQFGDLLRDAVMPLLPSLTKFVGFLADKMPGAVGGAINAVKGLVSIFAGLGGGGSGGIGGIVAIIKANFLPVLKSLATTFTTVILPTVQRFGAYLVANLFPIFKQVGTILVTNVLPILSSLARFFVGTIIPAVYAVVNAVGKALKPVFDQLFKTIQTSVLPTVQKLLVKFREWQPTIEKVTKVVLKIIGVLLVLAAKILAKVLPPLIRFAGFLIKVVVGAIIGVITVIAKIIGAFIKVGSAIGTAIGWFGKFSKAVDSKIRAALGFIKDLPGKAKSALGNLAGVLLQTGKDLIQGLIDGIEQQDHRRQGQDQCRAEMIKDHCPGPRSSDGPLKPWNNTGPTGPGGRLMGLLGQGISNSTAVETAMTRALTHRVSVPRISPARHRGLTRGRRRCGWHLEHLRGAEPAGHCP